MQKTRFAWGNGHWKFNDLFSRKREGPKWWDLLTLVGTLLNFRDKKSATSEASRCMHSNRGGAYEFYDHLSSDQLFTFVQPGIQRVHLQLFWIARCLFLLLSAFFRLLWQLFPVALDLFKLLCGFSDCTGSRFWLLSTFFWLFWQSFPFDEHIIFYANTPV